jgi:hypothetical protein
MGQLNIKQVRGGTQGSILFLGTNSTISENSKQLHWDFTNNRLGIGTASPSRKVHIYSTQSGAFQLQDGTQGAN